MFLGMNHNTTELQYYIMPENAESKGPFSAEYIKLLRSNSIIDGSCLVRPAAGEYWATYDDMFNPNCGNSMPAQREQNQQVNIALNAQRKSTGVYVVLALLFGTLGVHNFYADRAGSGVCQLILTLTGFGLFLTVPWCILDACLVRKDGKGFDFK